MSRLVLPLSILLLWLATPTFAGASQAIRAPFGFGIGQQRCDRGLEKQLDATLDFVQAAQGGGGGVQAVLMRHGRVLWSAERGAAIVDPLVPVDRHTLFAFASFGKLMLSAFALDRVESGALDLDAPISKYVGDSVPGSEVVTVRTLLTHTAGYPEVYESPEVGPLFAEEYDPNREWSFATLAPGIHDPVDPAARWAYSNTGYIVLARVLQAITPESLERAYIRFVRRAGVTERDLTMQRSPFALSRFAHGYVGDGSSLSDSFAGAAAIPTDLYGLPFGDGAFAGTATGAARFLDALFVRGRLLRYHSVRQMVEPTPQSLAAGPFGEIQSYGMGTASYNAAGRVWHGHDGTYVGFTAMGATDLRRGVSIAVLTNREPRTRQPAIVLWRALAETYADATRRHP